MKLIESSVSIMPQEEGLLGVYKQIELAGRTCYKSEDKITEDSAKLFVDRMVKSGHGAMLEHGTIYLLLTNRDIISPIKYINNKYSKVVQHRISENYNNEGMPLVHNYITTNYRALIENNWLDDLKYICAPTEYHDKRITAKFICDIGVSRECNRHRVNSIAEQSTRYCNYTKDKFNNQISIVVPEDIDDPIKNASKDWGEAGIFRKMCGALGNCRDSDFNIIDTWLFANLSCEWAYNNLVNLGWKAQQARRILPLDTATELIHTAFVSDWKHFFELRCDKSAHPDMVKLATSLREQFKNNNLI